MSTRYIISAVVLAAVIGTAGYVYSTNQTHQSPLQNTSAMTQTSPAQTIPPAPDALSAPLNDLAPAAGAPTAGASVATGAATVPSPQVIVAEFGDQKITKKDVEDLYNAIKERAGGQAPPMDDIFWMLTDQIVASRLIIEDAKKASLDISPEVIEALKAAREQIVQEAYIRNLFTPLDTEEALRPYYDAYVAGFKGQEEVHARHILVEKEEEAKDLIKQVKAGTSFDDLAKKFSQDPGSKENGGDLGFFTEDAMVPEFAKAAFAMKAGDVSAEPVKTQFGWHVIKVEERRPRQAPSFEEAKPQLQMQAQQEIIQKKITELRNSASITYPENKDIPPRPDDAPDNGNAPSVEAPVEEMPAQ